MKDSSFGSFSDQSDPQSKIINVQIAAAFFADLFQDLLEGDLFQDSPQESCLFYTCMSEFLSLIFGDFMDPFITADLVRAKFERL